MRPAQSTPPTDTARRTTETAAFPPARRFFSRGIPDRCHPDTPGSQLRLDGVGLNPTRTGLLDALDSMGADLQVQVETREGGEPAGRIDVRHRQLLATEISGPLVVRMIDEFPVFAVAAALAKGTTVVRQAEELRLKESDRIAMICQELTRLGVNIRETPDGFTVSGADARAAVRLRLMATIVWP